MKGISHFVSGVAAASFLPQAVRLAEGGSFVFVLAGLGGILPDTLDFRLTRYLARRDVEIDPDPNAPLPQAMAEQIASAVARAYETAKTVHVQFQTCKVGAGLWRQYAIYLGSAEREVRVRMGPLVTTSQVPYPDSELGVAEGRAQTVVPIRYGYGSEVRVDILDGPMLAFRRRGDEVEAIFLPWHRRWSHSLLLAAGIGALIALLLGPVYGLAYALGAATHIFEDQLGYLGGNLFFPLTRRRTRGLGLFNSGDVLPNLLAVWTSAAIILLNLDRFSANPTLNAWRYLGLWLALPWAALLGVSWWRQARQGKQPLSRGGAMMEAEVAAEMEDVAPNRVDGMG
jgi:membrane-bound metal-dependent hydrolase YbcI (DUF457 family)